MHVLRLTLVLVLTFSAAAAAQSRGRRHTPPPPQDSSVPSWSVAPRSGSPADGWPQDPLPTWSVSPLAGRPGPAAPLPQIGLPLPPIGLPLPPIGLQPPVGGGNKGRRHRGRGGFAAWPAWFVVAPYIIETEPADVQDEKPLPTTGSLAFDVQPAAVQIFVDGYYVGTTDDFAATRASLVLEAGPHRVELIAPAHDSLTFDVRITPNQAIVYRAVLKPAAAPVPPPVMAPPAPVFSEPATFYLIPGCYAGNVHPKDSQLRPSCDISRMITSNVR